MYIAPGQGLTTPWGQNFDVNRNILSLWSFVTSLKKISLKSDLIHFFFMILYMYIAPWQRQTAPRGQKFDVNRNVLSIHSLPICCKFQRNLFEVWFYTFFFYDLIHVYSPGQEHTAPRGTKFLCQQKLLVTSVISCQFQIIDDNSFWKIHCFYFFPIQKHRDQIGPCRKICHGQPRIIIWANLVVLKHPMMHTKIQGHWPFGSGEEDFFRLLPYMTMAAILDMWPWPFEQTFIPPSHRSSIWYLTLIGPVVSEEKMFKECGRRRTTTTYDGRQRPTYPISSPYEPSAQVS